MGKVLSFFPKGCPGAISRSVDDIVTALPNKESEAAFEFGEAVFLNASGNGGVKVTSSSTAAQFVGVAVRSPSKTPEEYLPDASGRNAGCYPPGELMDVLTRGSVVVRAAAAGPGKPVYLDLSSGKFTYLAGSNPENLALPNCHFRTGTDANGCAEMLVNTRNLI